MAVRAPQLHHALRAFTLGAFAYLLRELEDAGESLPFAFEEHAGHDGPALYEYRPLVRDFVEARAARLRGRDDVPEKAIRRIEKARSRVELEYLYEPFRPPRKTPGAVARERGLEPLAEAALKNEPVDPQPFVTPELTAEEAMLGAREILAERFAVDPEVRGTMFRAAEKEGVVSAIPAPGTPVSFSTVCTAARNSSTVLGKGSRSVGCALRTPTNATTRKEVRVRTARVYGVKSEE